MPEDTQLPLADSVEPMPLISVAPTTTVLPPVPAATHVVPQVVPPEPMTTPPMPGVSAWTPIKPMSEGPTTPPTPLSSPSMSSPIATPPSTPLQTTSSPVLEQPSASITQPPLVVQPPLTVQPPMSAPQPVVLPVHAAAPKWPLITLAVLAVIAVGVGGYYYWSNNMAAVTQPIGSEYNPAADLPAEAIPVADQTGAIEDSVPAGGEVATTTYTSTTNSYVFQYPDDGTWQVSATEGPMGETVAMSCESCSTGTTVDMFQVTPVIFTTFEEFMAEEGYSDKVQTTINGLEVVRSVQAGGMQAGGSSVLAFFIHNGQGYMATQRLRGSFDIDTFAALPVANPDVLSTFSFAN